MYSTGEQGASRFIYLPQYLTELFRKWLSIVFLDIYNTSVRQETWLSNCIIVMEYRNICFQNTKKNILTGPLFDYNLRACDSLARLLTLTLIARHRKHTY